MLDGLESRHLIVRIRSRKDRRVSNLELTEAGLQTTVRIERAFVEFSSRLLAVFSQEQRSTAIAVLELIGDLLEPVSSARL